MPTYVYKCSPEGECLPDGYVFEARQKFSDEPLTECPKCGGSVRRVINSVGIVFKGKGFYVTDNRGSSNGKNGSNKTSGDSKSEKKADASDSKAESKSESKSAESTSSTKEKPKSKESS